MQPSQLVARMLSLVFLALLVVSLGIRFWASGEASVNAGPTHLAANSEHVFVYAAGDFYHLSHAGELLAVHAAETAGLDDAPIDLRVTADGQLLIASQQPARLMRCDPELWVCRSVDFTATHRPSRQFKVLPDVLGHALLFTDAHGNSLWGWDGTSAEPKRLLPESGLAGPNDLAVDALGHVWLADTDHRRIAEFVTAADGTLQPGREHNTINKFTTGRRFFPVMVALAADGNVWVTQAAEFSEGRADLAVYHPDKGAVAQVSLPGGIFATDIAVMGDDVLVTDLDAYAVYRVNARSRSAGIFGDAAFIAELAGIRKQRDHFQRLSQAAMVAVVLCGILMVLAAIQGAPRDKRWSSVRAVPGLQASAAALPQVRGVYWLKRDRAFDRLLKFLRVFAALGAVLILAGTAFAFVWMQLQLGENPSEVVRQKMDQLGMVLLLSCGSLLFIIPVLIQAMNTLGHRLGTDGRRLHIRLHDGRDITLAPDEVAFTPRAILYHEYAVPVQAGKQQNIYEEGELETWIAAHLQSARSLGPWAAFRHRLKYRNPLLIWGLVMGAAWVLVLSFLPALLE